MADGSLGSMAHRSNIRNLKIVVSACPAQPHDTVLASGQGKGQIALGGLVFALDQGSG